MTADELAAAPEGTKSKDMTGVPGMKFVMTSFHPGLHRLRFLRSGMPGHEG